MINTKKHLSLLLSLALCGSLLTGCGGGGEEAPAPAPAESAAPEATQAVPEATPAPEAEPVPEAADHTGSWSFTDSLGRTAEFEGPLTKVAPSGKLAQQCIYAINPEVVIGLSNDLSDSEAKYYSADFAQLPVFGSFYGKKANFNRETVLAAGPQVIIDVGEPKNNMAEDLDALQEQLGVPVLFIEAKLTDMTPAFTALGELLDKPEQAKVLSDYSAETIADAQAKAAAIPEDQQKTVYYGMMDTGLTTAAKGDLHAEVLDLVGAQNVVPADLGHSFVDIDLERLLDWNPDVIVFAPHSVYETVGDDPLWKDLSAITSGSYYETPGEPYSWLDQPPAANRILGVKWLGNLLYPDVFDYDMAAEAVEFYDLFYHYDLTEADAKALMAHSTYQD